MKKSEKVDYYRLAVVIRSKYFRYNLSFKNIKTIFKTQYSGICWQKWV